MSVDELSDERKDLISQFQTITGLGPEDEIENIHKLLRVNDWNLNNSISTYFDSKFASVESQVISSGFEALDNGDNSTHLSHRAFSDRDNVMNLQSQFALDSFLPRLPKAHRISNNWQLDVGIHSSLKSAGSSADSKSLEQKKSPVTSIWLILLIIPKAVLQIIISIFRFLFGGSGNRSRSVNRFPIEFEYDNYDDSYSYLNWLTSELNGESNRDINYSDEKFEDVMEKVEEVDKRNPSVLDNFNIIDSGFNEVHEKTQSNFTWLLVILVNNNQEAQDFLQNLLTNDHFNRVFNKNDGIFKETSIYLNNVEKDPESFEVGQTYKVKKLPYVMLVGNVSNNPSILSSMSIVYKSNIPHAFISNGELAATIKKVLKNLHKLMDNFNAQLITQRIDKQEIEISRLLKQQQDDAYTESLEKDRLKRIQKENEIRMKHDLEELVKLRESFLFSLIQTNWFETLNDSPAPKIKISIKLPNGKRIIEVILTSITVNDLHLYIELKIFVNDLINSTLNDCTNEDEVFSYINSLQLPDEMISVNDYVKKFAFKFELIQPFPKKVFASTNEPISSIPELKSGVSLLVEYLQEDSDDLDSDDQT
ncbi:uncharacterized protein AC631_04714 [Debaryomyces fabryi]|uniref:UBX domain-containing protein n=1 Tax=Debaryomyces fabryi TaxID=58627 RepID=A0A0V1PTS6_9ASCO|nr:uncharacterized protein AC631_04714 [Debaryomyces fabryi]KRZ99524.1 hypothetical protein AC631_04714 [Debaryomyces fabryi]CUM46464.1 unnamed protein product [Debaryomyces fabryi]